MVVVVIELMFVYVKFGYVLNMSFVVVISSVIGIV